MDVSEYGLGGICAPWAVQTPQRVAISDGRTALSFAELEARACVFSRLLASRGVGVAANVVLLAEKCTEVVIAALAVWKVGAVYVPIDPESPPGRVELLLNSIEPRLIIGPRADLARYRAILSGAPVIALEDIVKESEPESCESTLNTDARSTNRVDLDGLAYILHTSGSTGVPKGVMMSHRSVLKYFLGHNKVLRFSSGSSCLNNAPFHFDVSIQDVFLPLSFGASVYLTRGMPIGAVLLRMLETHRITHLIAVATILTIITGDTRRLRQADLSALEVVMTGAETCDAGVINAWFHACQGIRVINGYGPTEANSISLTHVIDAPDEERTTFFPIGKPLSTVQVRLVDSDGEAIEDPNHVGELLIGGGQLMEGYWRKAEETEAAFSDIDGTRFYKTGDLVHRDELGQFHFDGRCDAEVKISGRRINLTEVQAALLRYSPTKNVGVGVIEHGAQKSIVAVLVGDDGRAKFDACGLQTLRQSMAHDLPAYMIPRHFGLCAEQVLLSSGKTDVRRLVKLLESAIDRERSEFYRIDADGSFQPLALG